MKKILFALLIWAIPVKAQVTLPVEIFGENEVESVIITVSDPTNVNALYIRAHGLTFEGKASVKVNNQDWISLSEATTDYVGQESIFRGFGKGPFHTVRLSIPLNEGVVQTTNTVQFRMNTDDNISQGWRVIDIKFFNGSTNVATTTLTFDDPGTWVPISTNPTDLANGFDVWTNAALTDPAVGGAITAKCADCHTTGAEDMVYFNYSDEAIINRCEFHGLSTGDCEDVASWIRSLDLPNPARPWTPVYQPGPGVDAAGGENWAAGAGLDAILETDVAMLTELWPDGNIDDDGPSDTRGNINVREQQTQVIFPDWAGWLPRVHPKDLWPSFTSSLAYQDYTTEVPAMLDEVNATGRLQREFETWNNADVGDFREQTDPDPSWSTKEWADANLSLMQWQIVKAWEMIRQNDLEDDCETFEPTPMGEDRVHGETLCWPTGQSRLVFDVAPHISGKGGQENSYSGLAHAKYMSHMWYELQMVLQAGSRDPNSLKPMDWKYQHGHTTDISGNFDTGSWVRLVRSFMKSMQQMDNTNGIGARGFYMRHAVPYWWRSLIGGNNSYNTEIWEGSTEEQRRLIATVLTRQFVERLYEFDINDWPRLGDEGVDELAALEPIDYDPILYDNYGWNDRFDYAEQIYNLPELLLERNVSATLVDSLARWGELAWPNGEWDQWYNSSGGDVSGNGTITALDAALILQHLAAIIVLDAPAQDRADVSGNGSVSTLDASLILQYVAETITCFPSDPGCS